MTDQVKVQIDEVMNTLENIYIFLNQEKREILIDSLMDAELRGIHSHGLIRTIPYYRRMKAGGIDIQTDIKVKKDHKAVMSVDGCNGIGQVIAKQAMTLAMEKSDQHGVGVVSVRNSQHFGTAGYYTAQAAKGHKVGMVFTNASARLAPLGGLGKQLGNNPWSIGFPSGKDDAPFLFDIANSEASAGKIRDAILNNRDIPDHWAISSSGELTTDPETALEGFLLPMAGHKGYGITLAMGMLTALLSEGVFEDEVTAVDQEKERQKVSHLFIAFDIASFTESDDFLKRSRERIETLKSVKSVPGQQVYYPGERSAAKKQKALERGSIKLSKPLWDELYRIGKANL